jgi:hypothetical protein
MEHLYSTVKPRHGNMIVVYIEFSIWIQSYAELKLETLVQNIISPHIRLFSLCNCRKNNLSSICSSVHSNSIIPLKFAFKENASIFSALRENLRD